MEKFIPYEKLSKKEKRKVDKARRQAWGELNPVTRKPANSKAYNRQKAQNWKKELPNSVPLSFYISSRISSANSSRSSGTPCFRMPHLGQDKTGISLRSFFRNCCWKFHSTMLSQIFFGVGG